MCRSSQESRELGLFGVFLAISAWIECESTSSSVIAPRLFPFLYMSIFVWLAAGSPCFRAAAAYINECLLRHLRTLLVRIRASTGLAALASATVRLMQNTTRMGRPKDHVLVVPGYEETIRWALTASWVVAQKVVESRWRLGRRGGRN